MPKAAAIPPLEWATVHPGLGTFDIGELNRVVLDYGRIELETAKRWTRRSALGRACAAIMACLKVIGLLAAVLLGISLAAGVDGEGLVPLVYACSGLGCLAVVGFYVPWALTPYRQWDRSLCGISAMFAVVAAVSIGSVLVRDFEAAPRWLLVTPCAVLLVMAIGAIVGDFRFRTTVKPPPVDLAALSPEEIEILFSARRKALRQLRARSVVSYLDFDELDRTPLDAPRSG
jgi:hypothetical protein